MASRNGQRRHQRRSPTCAPHTAENSRFSTVRPSAANTLPLNSGLIGTGSLLEPLPLSRERWPSHPQLKGRKSTAIDCCSSPGYGRRPRLS
jgi:hypothetical protein